MARHLISEFKMTATKALVLIATWAIIGSAQGQGKVPYDWKNAPYDNDDFNVKVHYSKDAILECNDTRVSGIEGKEVLFWVTPELEILKPGSELEFNTLDGLAGWYVSGDGFQLHINLTHDRHFGMYYCMLNDSDGQEWAVKTAINFKGAYWGNVWWRYETATIWSIVGSAVCAAIFTIGAFLWTRFEDDTDEINPDEDDFDAILAKLGYNNNDYDDACEKNGKPPASDMQIRENPQMYENMDSTAAPPVEDVGNGANGGYDFPISVNDEIPDPYYSVIEINGSSKAKHDGQETVGMKELDKTTTAQENSSAAIEIVDDIRL
ncbi:hypothetical protein CAPTEDRAFT_203912 [Capitella teleta]|uniref:Ig-like domain-containing protein n=1 Tax=Capitella teleta TaxID=283909 RepID=R7UUI3_CAPTE|nr:hypothetical protein CAPTEDRAFT_203912 [Capitella teleta]|eukprot:ELU10293.1 hypothetical protein CAPTEDRAFT_203912 [Capitella teleta]